MVAQVEVPGAHTVTVVNRKLGPVFTVSAATLGAGSAMVLPLTPPVPIGVAPELDEAAVEVLEEPPLPQPAASHRVATRASVSIRPKLAFFRD
jgi:hypothetical protein